MKNNQSGWWLYHYAFQKHFDRRTVDKVGA